MRIRHMNVGTKEVSMSVYVYALELIHLFEAVSFRLQVLHFIDFISVTTWSIHLRLYISAVSHNVFKLPFRFHWMAILTLRSDD